MNFQVIGANYKTALVKEREKIFEDLKDLSGTLLATCNRVELYTVAQLNNYTINNEGTYYYKNTEAVRHLFRVASGLDSQILGETEILGQVRKAYLESREGNWRLNQLFEKALEAGRRVRAETGISRGNISIAAAAVSKASHLLSNNKRKKILLVGTGKVTESILKILLKSNFNFIWVANRNYEKALALAEKTGGRAIHFNQLEKELAQADLVISSTSAPHLVIKRRQIRERKKPLFIIDLAVPRDVEAEVSQIPKVRLLNIDDIKEEIGLSLMLRKIEAVFAEKIINEEVKEFCEKFALAPAAVG